MAPHSSTLAWKIPWTEKPGRLQSTRSQRVGHNCETSLSLFTFMLWKRKWQPTPVFLRADSQGRGSLVGCCLWSSTESDMTEVTQQQQQHSIAQESLYSVFCGDLNRQEIHKRGHTCTCIADSYCCRAKTTQECKETIVQQIFKKFYRCTHAFPLTHKHINLLESSLCFAHT